MTLAAPAQPFITPALSVYLDLARFVAALAVLIGHIDPHGQLWGAYSPGRYGHEAVIVFFVLSGLVIAASAERAGNDWRAYAVARLTRVYSVVVPALLLGLALGGLALWLDPALKNDALGAKGFNLSDIATSLLFLNHSWTHEAEAPFNIPYWSLCYEVWYYIIFGLAFFAPPHKRVFWTALACIVAGPAILLLMPVWLLGVWLARRRPQLNGPPWLAVALVPATWCAVAAINLLGYDIAVRIWLDHYLPGFWRVPASRRFATDIVLGALVALNFIAFRSLPAAFTAWIERLKVPAATAAAYTFSIYLFHYPVISFFRHFYPQQASQLLPALAAALGTLMFCVLLGHFTERRPGSYRRAFMRWLPR